MKPKQNKHATRSSSGKEPKPLHVMAKAVTVGLLATTVLLLLFSFLFCRQDLPFSLLHPLATFALTAGALCAGYLASRSLKSNGLLVGGGCGAVIFMLLLLASLQSKVLVDWTAILKLMIALLGGAIGGVMGVNAKGKSRFKKGQH